MWSAQLLGYAFTSHAVIVGPEPSLPSAVSALPLRWLTNLQLGMGFRLSAVCGLSMSDSCVFFFLHPGSVHTGHATLSSVARHHARHKLGKLFTRPWPDGDGSIRIRSVGVALERYDGIFKLTCQLSNHANSPLCGEASGKTFARRHSSHAMQHHVCSRIRRDHSTTVMAAGLPFLCSLAVERYC